MNPELRALARRAVACKGWRWMPGMLAHHPNWRAGRVSHVGVTAVRVACRYPSPVGGTKWAVPLLPITVLLPDLSDPATLGCLMALVNPSYWHINTGHVGEAEAEALVAALEAASL